MLGQNQNSWMVQILGFLEGLSEISFSLSFVEENYTIYKDKKINYIIIYHTFNLTKKNSYPNPTLFTTYFKNHFRHPISKLHQSSKFTALFTTYGYNSYYFVQVISFYNVKGYTLHWKGMEFFLNYYFFLVRLNVRYRN